MSDVTPAEIVDMVMHKYRVTKSDMRHPFGEGSRNHNVFIRPGYAARVCCMYLIQRHTRAKAHEICESIGTRRQDIRAITNCVSRFTSFCDGHEYATNMVEAVEDEIDRIHERRCDEYQRILESRKEEEAHVFY